MAILDVYFGLLLELISSLLVVIAGLSSLFLSTSHA